MVLAKKLEFFWEELVVVPDFLRQILDGLIFPAFLRHMLESMILKIVILFWLFRKDEVFKKIDVMIN